MLDTTPQTQEQENTQVKGAIEKILALQDLEKSRNMRTTHTQSAVLKALSAGALTRVAVILKKLAAGGTQ